jgi:arylsulfatase A-like enzyme
MGQPDAIPNRQGFDQFFGYLNQRKAHSYFPPFLWDNAARHNYPAHAGHEHHPQSSYDADGFVIPYGVTDPKKAKFSFNEIHSRSLDFIREHQEEPFFLYLAHTLPHGPAIAPNLGPYRDKPWAIGHKEWAAMVTRLDQGVGDVLALLEQLDLDDNTLVLFASDNGHSTHGYDRDKSVTPIGQHFNSFGPTRGRKGDTYDGAFRVPAVARWPGRIKPGTVSDHAWAFWDFLPTAAELVGLPASSVPNVDGVSFAPTLRGKSKSQRKHDYLYWEYNQNQAVRTGGWFAHRKNGGSVELYDLTTDPQQKDDLADRQPMLIRQIGLWMDESHTPSDVWPSPGESSQEFKVRLQRAGVSPRVVNIDG